MVDTLDTVKNATREGSRAMPSTSPKQARTMAAAAHNPQFAKKMGIPQGVAQDFNQADAATGSLKAAMKDRAIRQGGPPGKKDERTESPAEKAREKRLGIP